MDLSTALKHAINGNALLFLGSGFSVGAKPIKGDNFLTGRELAKYLSKECLLNPISDDLSFAAQRYRRAFSDEKLIEELTDLFTASSVTNNHKRFSEIPWKSIFTTNYDNVLERAFLENRKRLNAITLSNDTNEYTTKKNIVVHINGYIDSLNSESLNDSFKLTNTSYLTESFSKSNWSFLFRRYLEACSSIIFVGYSMYDLDIQRIIYEYDTKREKTIFIERPGLTEDEIKSSIQYDFGTVLPIGLDGFWQEFDNIKSTYSPQDTSSTILGFEEIEAPSAPKDFRDDYLFDMLLKGTYDLDFVWNNVHGNSTDKYFIVREHHNETLDLIKKGTRNVITFSDMANGKTLFLVGIVCALISREYRAFWLKDESENVTTEIDYITSINTPVVIIIENYHRRLNEIKYIELNRHPDLLLLLSAKTTSHEHFQDDVLTIISAEKTIDVDLNKLSDTEIKKINDILTTYKIWGDRDAWNEDRKLNFIKNNCDRNLSAVLLEVIKSPIIQQKFKSLFNSFTENPKLTDIIVTASVLKLLGFDRPQESMICELTDSDYLRSLDFKRNPFVRELLSLSGGNVIPRSSVLAKHGLTNFIESRSLVDHLIRIATFAHDRGLSSNLYFSIYKDLVTFSNLQSMLPEKGKRDASIRFYEAIKNLSSARYHPHFWLQYAIARLASETPEDLEKAKLFLDSAYAHALKRTNYHTLHMDNVKARYLILHSSTIKEINSAVIELNDGHALLLRQCRTEQSSAPYKAARNYLNFYNKRKHELSDQHKLLLVKISQQILDYIPKLKNSIQSEQVVRFCKTNLESLIADIKSS